MPSTKDLDNGFVEWLAAQLAHKRWSEADLARAAGVHQAAISSLMNREKGLGVELAKKLAAALELSQYVVFYQAGLLDEELYDDDKASKEYLRLLAAIKDDDERQAAIDTVETVLRRIAECNRERDKASRSGHAGRPAAAKS